MTKKPVKDPALEPKYTPHEIRGPYSPRLRVGLEFEGQESKTHQSFKDQCDINNIVRRHAQGDVLHHVNTRPGRFLDVTPMDFREAMQTVVEVREAFDGLSAQERSEYANDPETYLAVKLEQHLAAQTETPEARESEHQPEAESFPKESVKDSDTPPAGTAGSPSAPERS